MLHAWGDDPLGVPVLAGQREKYLIGELAGFVRGARPGSQMHGPIMRETLQAPDVNWAQAFRDLAAYLSAAPRNPRPDTGPGNGLTTAERNYRQGCLSCHAIDGAGSDEHSVPAIGGQGYGYLRTQLREFAAARRRHPTLANSPVALSSDEQLGVADYVSRLGYLTAAVKH